MNYKTSYFIFFHQWKEWQRMTSPDSPGKSILHTHGVLVPSGITVPLNYWLGLNHWGQQISGEKISRSHSLSAMIWKCERSFCLVSLIMRDMTGRWKAWEDPLTFTIKVVFCRAQMPASNLTTKDQHTPWRTSSIIYIINQENFVATGTKWQSHHY